MKRWCFVLCLCGTLCWGQIPSGDGFVSPNRPADIPGQTPSSTSVGVENLKQDMEANQKDVKELTLRVEQLERDKAELEAKISKSADMSSFATHDELKLLEMRMNDAIAEQSKKDEAALKDDLKSAMAASAEKPASLAPAAKTSSKAASAPTPVSDAEKQSYMKEGVRYVVQPGDSLSSIARKYHSSVRAIMATNSINSPNKLYVGRELFVPTL